MSDTVAMVDELVSVNKAAEILGKSPRTIMRWAATGKITAQKVSGEWQVKASDVRRIADADRHNATNGEATEELHAEITDLKDEISLLKSQLVEKDKQIEQLHILLGRAQPKQLEEPGKKRWWQFWRR